VLGHQLARYQQRVRADAGPNATSSNVRFSTVHVGEADINSDALAPWRNLGGGKT